MRGFIKGSWNGLTCHLSKRFPDVSKSMRITSILELIKAIHLHKF